MTEREKLLEDALRAFLRLSWSPDAAPGPSCYLVEPVHEARNAMKQAGILLDGKSPFPSDNNGSALIIVGKDGSRKISIWLDGMAYGEDRRDRVPPQHLELFDKSVREHKTPPAS